MLANHYGLQYNNPTPQVMPTSQQVQRGEERCFVFQSVTPDDVQKVILDMPANKAPGFDKVPISVVKGQMNQNFDIRSLATLKQLNTKTDHYKVYSPKNFAS